MPRRPRPLESIHIRPISDLRNKSLEISKLAHESKSPIFITRNGREDMVVMSMAQWEDLYVYPVLLEEELKEAMGEKSVDFDEAMGEIEKKLGLGKWRGKKKAGGTKTSRRP